ncbi:TPA: hypothetical protein KD105_004585 [Vibrio parahaemolyticus]|nr:hypothetical protein [Vibrio parahaemolyticus]HBC3607227.1 hypothetical protein [Vibrio parahaemolyticus]
MVWYYSLSTLRAIGHVLHKVDAEKYSPEFSSQLNERYKRWKHEPIFKDFINEERNKILKEYDSTVEPQEVKKTKALATSSGLLLATRSGNILGATVTLRKFVKARGYRAGKSPVIVLSQALEWWDCELKEMEKFI